MQPDNLKLVTGSAVRLACRNGLWTKPTCGLAEGFAQGNLVVLPKALAYDFLLFCQRNPKPCPLLDVTEPGDPVPRLVAPDADLRTDLPRYRVWKHGELVDEPTDITNIWQSDFVSFVIGCSFTFESAMMRAGLPVRHLELGCNVPMFRTNMACRSAGVFHGPLVVSMRPMTPADAVRAVQVTSRYPLVHGAPIHIGNPAAIGIGELTRPDFGDSVPIQPDEIPVFWACGVTPQAAIMSAKLPLVITHSPGCMFLTDVRDEELAVDGESHEFDVKRMETTKTMLRHAVLFKFKAETSKEQIKQIEEAFRGLPSKIDSIRDFEWGTDVSPEEKSKGFTHCFFVTFADEKGRDAYLPHAAHQDFVTIVRAHVEDVCVVDYWTGK